MVPGCRYFVQVLYNKKMTTLTDSELLNHTGLFPIRHVCAETGINPVTLRAWERRYGLIQPVRTAKGHRLYSAEDIVRIRRIFSLIEEGVAVSQVGRVLEQEPDGDVLRNGYSAEADVSAALTAASRSNAFPGHEGACCRDTEAWSADAPVSSPATCLSTLGLQRDVLQIVDGAVEVLHTLGPGLVAETYANALVVEFDARGVSYRRDSRFPVIYKTVEVGFCVLNLLCEQVPVEVKTLDSITDMERCQMLSYLAITEFKVGLILNFRYAKLQWEHVVCA